MTCGIYILKFNNTDKVYIGQSVHIEKRYKEHLTNLKNFKSVSKLQEAYKLFGLPELSILLECSISELDSAEEEAIQIYDSVNNGFNTYSYANEAPSYTGHGGGNSKYTKEEILSVVQLLASGSLLSDKEIANITGVSFYTVNQLANLSTHQWVWEDYPDLREKVLLTLATKRERANTIVSDKLSASARGIIYPNIRSPEGDIFSVTNAYKFAKERGLAPNHFQEVLNGHRKSHKGWKLA